MVSEGNAARRPCGEVEARLTAAGCPDADFDAGELFRLATGGTPALRTASLTANRPAAGSPDGPPRGAGAAAIPLRQLAFPGL